MARIHARKRGQSGSSRPVEKDLSFVGLKAKEVEDLIVDIAKKEALSPSQIGLRLRDTYGVPSVRALCGKKITQILDEAGELRDIPEDLRALVDKRNKLKKHLATNTRDTHNKRGLLLIESKIRRLSNYYKEKGRLPKKWGYN